MESKDPLAAIDVGKFKLMDTPSRRALLRGMTLKNLQKLCRRLGIKDDGHVSSIQNKLAQYNF